MLHWHDLNSRLAEDSMASDLKLCQDTLARLPVARKSWSITPLPVHCRQNQESNSEEQHHELQPSTLLHQEIEDMGSSLSLKTLIITGQPSSRPCAAGSSHSTDVQVPESRSKAWKISASISHESPGISRPEDEPTIHQSPPETSETSQQTAASC